MVVLVVEHVLVRGAFYVHPPTLTNSVPLLPMQWSCPQELHTGKKTHGEESSPAGGRKSPPPSLRPMQLTVLLILVCNTHSQEHAEEGRRDPNCKKKKSTDTTAHSVIRWGAPV